MEAGPQGIHPGQVGDRRGLRETGARRDRRQVDAAPGMGGLQKGVNVLLCEKGAIAAEQSSRNWGGSEKWAETRWNCR